MSFSQFNLKPFLKKAITELGFENPTEIQAEAIPLLLEHQGDFVGQAQTGTGKTLAFGIPLVEAIDDKLKHVQALILTPTRELANQVSGEIKKLVKHAPISVVTIYGGASYVGQKKELSLKSCKIVVGTPGRLIDLIEQGALKLSQVKNLIIDEADEMLNMGFLEDVQKIISCADEQRKIWLFSATMPKPIEKLINTHFSDIEYIKMQNATSANEMIDQHYCMMPRRNFADALKRILAVDKNPYGIVFCETKIETKELAEDLQKCGLSVAPLHGDLSQNEREITMAKFRSKRANILVCTDVASRGLDIKNINHVFNIGLPRNVESYVHRIGRTGRAGSDGMAISFVTPSEQYKLRNIERTLKVKLKSYALPSTAQIKENKINAELDGLAHLKEALIAKGADFKIDETFTQFKKFFDGMSYEQALQLIFAWRFDSEFKKMKETNIVQEKAKEDKPQGSQRSSRRGSSNFRNNRSRRPARYN